MDKQIIHVSIIKVSRLDFENGEFFEALYTEINLFKEPYDFLEIDSSKLYNDCFVNDLVAIRIKFCKNQSNRFSQFIQFFSKLFD